MTEVAAALIWDNDKFLICQRPPHKTRGLLWEFVGGKLEPAETARRAVVRECKEELDIEIKANDVFMDVVHNYPDMDVHLTIFNCEIISGEIKLLEHNDAKWITPRQIPQYDFCPADKEILKKIIKYH